GRTRACPPAVRPLVNGDPLVIRQLATLRSQRETPKRYDVCMVVRVWGGKDEVEGVEHNLRLLEAVARARGSKLLYAYLVAGDIEATRRRLERLDIPCGTDPLPQRKLWLATAGARLHVLRPRMHHRIPRRVTGRPAIGSAIVPDGAPLTRWPEPLLEGTNFLALGAETDAERPLAAPEQYAAIPEKINAWLADDGLAARIGRSNGAYFDRRVDPLRV